MTTNDSRTLEVELPRGNVAGTMLVAAICVAFWLPVGVWVGYRWCAATRPEMERQAQLVAEVKYANQVTGLSTELTVCMAGLTRAEMWVDSIHEWVHSTQVRGPDRWVGNGLPARVPTP